MTSGSRPPWKKASPRKKAGASTKLTYAEKSKAKASARKAVRRYPNLVDNMSVAKKRKSSATRG